MARRKLFVICDVRRTRCVGFRRLPNGRYCYLNEIIQFKNEENNRIAERSEKIA